MLKKRIPVQQTTRPVTKPASSSVRPTKAAAPTDEDDEPLPEDEDEPLPEEEAPKTSTKPKTPTSGSRGNGGGKKTSSLAKAFDDIPASNNADNLPPGKYEAIIKDVVMQKPDAKGQSARMHFELCGEDFRDQNSITTWFKLFDVDEQPVGGGIRAMKQTLAKLGYEPSFDELEECFDQITEEKPGVLLKVSYSKDNSGNEWQRAVVEDLCDNEIVQEYKDNVPY